MFDTIICDLLLCSYFLIQRILLLIMAKLQISMKTRIKKIQQIGSYRACHRDKIKISLQNDLLSDSD